jgi:hypothetical protein
MSMSLFPTNRLPFGLGTHIGSFSRPRRHRVRQHDSTSTGASILNFVYVIAGAHGLVKIGTTSNMDARLAALRTSSPFALHLTYALAAPANAGEIERRVHLLLDDRRAGEWFDCTPETAKEMINRVASEFGIAPGSIGSDRAPGVLNAAEPLQLMGGSNAVESSRKERAIFNRSSGDLAIIALLGTLVWFFVKHFSKIPF